MDAGWSKAATNGIREEVVTNMSNKMNAVTKGVGLAIVTSVVTMGTAVLIIVLATMLFIDTTSCGAVSRALPVLWATIAAVFLASVVVVAVVAWKIVAGIAGRLAIVAVYGVVMLASYVFIAFGLLVVFNC